VNIAHPAIGYIRPVVEGLIIAAVGILPWLGMARLNARVHPEVPWATILTLVYMGVLLAWLNGAGPPRKSAEDRRRRLRLRSQTLVPDAPLTGALPAALGLVVLSVVWTIIGRSSAVPDLAAYPTTEYRWSVFLMSGVMAGVVEEAAFRGYMQTGLEKIDPGRAIFITSFVFAASHITHGIGAVLLLGPGFFVTALLYGVLARQTGSILPGMIIHILGDLSHTFFGRLRGDAGLLFVN
jgi:membrane protease YdiL (CAAX protease family)